MIPKVKPWKVTFVDGSVILVWAPTRRLAILNTRMGEGRWDPIKTVGLPRIKSGDSRERRP